MRHVLPAKARRVLEIGCGPEGGFVPELLADGREAIGVDPTAPDLPEYRQVEFELAEINQPVDAVVACVSLHHVADLDTVMAKAHRALVPGGALIVVEWDWRRFDEATATWCFERLGPPSDEHSWLHHHREEWQASGRSWGEHLQAWATEEALHTGPEIQSAVAQRFEVRSAEWGPYFFPDLPGVTEADEAAAIEAGQIRPNRLLVVAHRP